MPISIRRRAALAAVSTLALSGLVPTVAGAATKPDKCDPEYLVEDGSGDAIAAPLGALGLGAQSHPGPDNADITNLFLNTNKGVVTANIGIADLSLTLPAETDSQGGLNYYVIYSLDGAVRFVRATNQSGTDMAYAYGTIDPSTGVYTTDGTTTGTLVQGKDGVIQIVVPAAAGGKAGADLIGVEATADGITGYNDVAGINNHFDEAPDGANVSAPNGFEYAVHECPAPKKKAAATTRKGRSAKR